MTKVLSKSTNKLIQQINKVTMEQQVDVAPSNNRWYNGKFLFKVVFNTNMSERIKKSRRQELLQKRKNGIKGRKGNYFRYWVSESTLIADSMKDIMDEIVSKKDMQYRFDCLTLTVYFRNEKDVEKILAALSAYAEERSKSLGGEKEFYVSTMHYYDGPTDLHRSVVIREKLPHDKYRYKAYFDHKKVQNSHKQLLRLVGNNDGAYRVSWYVEYNLKYNKEIGKTAFIYVETEKDLFALGLLGADFIKKVEEYKLKDEFETSE